MSNPEKFFITIERELFAEDLDDVVKEIQKYMKNGPNFLEHSLRRSLCLFIAPGKA